MTVNGILLSNKKRLRATYYIKINTLSERSQTQKITSCVIPYEIVEKANYSDRKHFNGCQRPGNAIDCKEAEGNFLTL